jgi:hypothetical protein
MLMAAVLIAEGARTAEAGEFSPEEMEPTVRDRQTALAAFQRTAGGTSRALLATWGS